MSEDEYDGTFVRFVMPFSLVVLGIVTIAIMPVTGSLSARLVSTIGFGMFAAGAFSFVLIYNHARNPMVTNNIISGVGQALVIYGGLLSALLYQEILGIGPVVIAVGIVFVIGVFISAVAEVLNIEYQDSV
jgi:hypothetical protein